MTTKEQDKISDWATALQEAKESSVDSVPAGWKSMDQLARELNSARSYVRDRINPLLGIKFERKKFRVELPAGSIRSIFHYRIISGGKSHE